MALKRRSGGRWGQNFLTDPAVAGRIADRVSGRRTLEIGPGRGALTGPLLARCPRVLAVEIDPRLREVLEERFAREIAEHGLVLRAGDAARGDWSAWLEALFDDADGEREDEPPAALAANLPYQVGTSIVLDFLRVSARDARLDRAVVMLQLEVVERLVAGPGTKAYGSLTVLTALTHQARLLFKVGAGSFRPRPAVTSAVVELLPLEEPLVAAGDREEAARFVQMAFARRRKQLATVLAGQVGLSRDDWRERLARHGHPPTARAEELMPAELVALRFAGLDGAPSADLSAPSHPLHDGETS